MRTYAHIVDGSVFEKIETDADISTLFNPELIWVDVSDLDPQPEVGWGYDGEVFFPPSEDVLDLSQLKEQAAAAITAQCAAAIDGGFRFEGHRYDSDLVSRTNIIGTATGVQAGIPLPDGFTWRTSDNQNVPIDGPGVIMLGGALLEHVNTQYAISWHLKSLIDAATTPEEIEAISWPPDGPIVP